MRQIILSNTVKGIYLEKNKVINELREIAKKALEKFPEILEIHLFGSIANNTYTGISDIDIFILIEKSNEKNPIERLKPYYFYFSDFLNISFDLLVCTKRELNQNDFYKKILKNSIILIKRSI
ncbi:MAG: hypothetical protein KatS3mg129_3029 [Leptospiraceae bacterium]|nr:MAG: hypothetical protein KatS3mg129_3029 [Leptospiraceae bacterium]